MACASVWPAHSLPRVSAARQRPDLAIHKFAQLIDAGKPIPVFWRRHNAPRLHLHRRHHRRRARAIDYDQSDYEIINLGESRDGRIARFNLVIGTGTGARRRKSIDSQGNPVMFHKRSRISRKRGDYLNYNPQTR